MAPLKVTLFVCLLTVVSYRLCECTRDDSASYGSKLKQLTDSPDTFRLMVALPNRLVAVSEKFFQILNIHKLKRSLWINGTIDSVAIYLFENPISGSKS
jgi:hypothetical protein